MIVANTRETALPTRQRYRLENGTHYWKTDYFGGRDADPAHPQAFLVEQEAASLVRPHFHDTSQFQVVIGGAGAMGKHALTPVTVHYAAAYTGYGPIVADGEGLIYFTLRDRFAARPHFFPEDRGDMVAARRRNLSSEPLAVGEPGSLPPGSAELAPALPEQPDGVAAWMARLGPDGRLPLPDPALGGGQYLLVLAGAALQGEQTLPELGVAFSSQEAPPAGLLAGPQGATALLLRFARTPNH